MDPKGSVIADTQAKRVLVIGYWFRAIDYQLDIKERITG
jgi:hypothetical protein